MALASSVGNQDLITTLGEKWSILRDLWTHILDKKVILENPNKILNIIPTYRANLLIDQQHGLITKEIDGVKDLMALASSVGNQDLTKLTQELSALEGELQSLARDIDECNQQIKKLRQHKTMIQEIESMQSRLRDILDSRTLLHEEILEAHRRTIFNTAIKHVNTTLARKEGAIAEIRGQRAIIADIESQISMLQEDEEALKLLTQELSPKEGLIAEGLFGFIKVFTSQWNKLVLEKVFSYQFSVLPCAVDEANGIELDYQFPVMIGSHDKPIDDISLTSKGQMELLDLGFVIVAMKHLGLHDFPLILDEFGANLDSSHRSKATNLVKSLMEQHPFPQLFMVNHYDSIYGAFTNAQTTVLCSDNIVIPKDCVYNQHVRINP
jgi:prefoldin subunit 5